MSSPWKCPHCGTPQAEAARCWSCKRSPLACSTCHDFRRSVAGKLGYCGKDKARAVLTGDEVRPCWSAPASVEEPPLIGLFGALEPTPARPAAPTRPAAKRRPVPPVFTAPEPSDPMRAEVAPTGHGLSPSAEPIAALAGDAWSESAASPESAPPVPVVSVQRGPAPTAAVAARRRWDAIMADVAAGAPLGSEPTGGATPSVPHRPAPGATAVPPWLASPTRGPDAAPTPAGRPAGHEAPTATTTATPPSGTPALPTAATPAPWSRALLAATAPGTDTGTLALPPRTTPAPWTAPMPSESPDWAMSADDLTPSEPIRWRHRAIDDPAPPVTQDAGQDPPARRATSLSLIPATLANRLRRHLGTRGPRAEVPDPTPRPSTPSASSSLTSPSVRGATPIATTSTMPYGRLVEAPPVTGTIVSLGDQLRRAEQLRRERALLDDQRLAGERGLDPSA